MVAVAFPENSKIKLWSEIFVLGWMRLRSNLDLDSFGFLHRRRTPRTNAEPPKHPNLNQMKAHSTSSTPPSPLRTSIG
ncbi:hypothetical protein D9758_015599 [Tetrapyrgos nigripes]|uniref:Uncharacterized protein n=1 Tax=Tetrapyrgos nigripes TaxID=182062 RepID=A0A8H5FK82_9AGAR|nr:hypothetical protein D9758_015599 [Tetrapyrgos nigripes]